MQNSQEILLKPKNVTLFNEYNFVYSCIKGIHAILVVKRAYNRDHFGVYLLLFIFEFAKKSRKKGY